MPTATPQVIDIETWRDWQEQGRSAQLVDVRSPTEFAATHLPGAINIPLEQIELRTADLDAASPVVLVCQAGTRARMAKALLEKSGRLLVVLDGGTDAWVKAGYPAVRSTAARWAVERQVRLIAGGLVVIGTLLAVLITPWLLVIPAFVGCGLGFAGISGLCPVGEMLARLPCNRPRKGAGITASIEPQGISCACKLPDRQ